MKTKVKTAISLLSDKKTSYIRIEKETLMVT